MGREYKVFNDKSLIEKMTRKYGYEKNNQGRLHSKTRDSFRIGLKDSLAVFLFENGNNSVVVDEISRGKGVTSHYDVEVFLTGENPKGLKDKLENDLEIELKPLK